MINKRLYQLCLVIAGIGIIVQIISSLSYDIWVDEAFALGIIRNSYWKVISLTAIDVHPPLYYLILKACIDAAHLFSANVPEVFLAKLISTVPYCLVLGLCVTKVRKNWGTYVAGLCAVAMVGMPRLIGFGVEIRMYSWGLFFVFAAYLQFYDIIRTNEKKKWVLFVIYSLAAAYTHYFACVSVACLYLGLFVYYIFNKREQIIEWIFASGVTIIGYLPWLFVFLKQAKTVSENYWIGPVSFETLKQYFRFIFWNPFFLLFCSFCIFIFMVIKGKKLLEDKDVFFVVMGIFVPVGTVAVGIAASLLIRPVFVERYMVPALMCLWLGIILAVFLTEKSWLNVCLAMILLVISAISIVEFTTTEQTYSEQSKKTMDFVSGIQDEVYVIDNRHVQRTLRIMSDDECYMWQADDSTNELLLSVFGCDGVIDSVEDIYEWLAEGRTVYLVDSSEGAKFGDVFADETMSFEDQGSFRVEKNVRIYKISEK